MKLGCLEEVECKTKNLRIHGFTEDPHFENEDPYYYYGSDRPLVKKLIDENAGYDELLDAAFPYMVGQVVWAVRHEMALHIEDVIARRFRALFLNVEAAKRIAPKVAEIMANEREKGEDWINNELEDFNKIASTFLY
jgi:glycerol-3-phosphate dehydrogenase